PLNVLAAPSDLHVAFKWQRSAASRNVASWLTTSTMLASADATRCRSIVPWVPVADMAILSGKRRDEIVAGRFDDGYWSPHPKIASANPPRPRREARCRDPSPSSGLGGLRRASGNLRWRARRAITARRRPRHRRRQRLDRRGGHGEEEKTARLLEADRRHVLHPYASMTDPPPTFPVRSARGVHVELRDGSTVVDGMSSWWAAVHGYRNPVLDAAVREQAGGSMSHVMFGGLTHAPAVGALREAA
ncbi:hypothetical protein THAOC_16705, partial [Thalassiosira oceanica]